MYQQGDHLEAGHLQGGGHGALGPEAGGHGRQRALGVLSGGLDEPIGEDGQRLLVRVELGGVGTVASLGGQDPGVGQPRRSQSRSCWIRS